MVSVNSLFLFLTAICNLSMSALGSAKIDEAIVEGTNFCSISTKRIWFNITSTEFENANCNFIIEWKKSLLTSDSESGMLQQVNNYNGSTYYYIDIPIECEAIRVGFISTSKSQTWITKWKCNLYPARLYEIYNGSDIMRYRFADIYPPDAYILGMVFSSYYSCNPSYENGYSAYDELSYYWLSNYAGNVNGSFENTYLSDYSLYCTNPDREGKTRLISLSEKIEEIKKISEKNPNNGRIVDKRLKSESAMFFCITFLVSITISILFTRKKKTRTWIV